MENFNDYLIDSHDEESIFIENVEESSQIDSLLSPGKDIPLKTEVNISSFNMKSTEIESSILNTKVDIQSKMDIEEINVIKEITKDLLIKFDKTKEAFNYDYDVNEENMIDESNLKFQEITNKKSSESDFKELFKKNLCDNNKDIEELMRYIRLRAETLDYKFCNMEMNNEGSCTDSMDINSSSSNSINNDNTDGTEYLSKSSYSPEEFFKAVRMKTSDSSEKHEIKSSSETSYDTASEYSSIKSVRTQPSSIRKAVGESESNDNQKESTSTLSPGAPINNFSYKSPEEFIKAVMISNSPDKSKISPQTSQELCQNQMKPFDSFKSVMNALPSVPCNKSTPSYMKQQSLQDQQRQSQGQCYPISLSRSCQSKSSSYGIAKHQQEIKVKINKVKDKFFKIGLTNNAPIVSRGACASFQAINVNKPNQGPSHSNIKDSRIQQTSVHSISRSVSESGTSINSVNVRLDKPAKLKKRNRTKREQEKCDHCNCKNECNRNEGTKIEHSQLNAETLLILDLLALPSDQRDIFLIDLAKKRKILRVHPNTFKLELDPKLEYFRQQILRTEKLSPFACKEDTKYLKKILDKVANDSKKIPRTFEDYVNCVVAEGLSEEKIPDFTFPKVPKKDRKVNYFKSDEFTKNLEKFAKKCVDAGLGTIIEEEIRINARNNEQAFMKNVDGERDAIIISQLSRKYALQGDIVKAFVRKPSSQPESSSSNSSPEDSPKASTSEPVKEGVGLAELIADDVIEEQIVPEKSCKAFVIEIVKEVHNRKCVGTFLSYRKGADFITFVPRDTKLPTVKVFKENWPDNLENEKFANLTDTLYAAQIIEWRGDICVGKILHPIGKCDELESENQAILFQNNLKMDPYETNFNEKFYGPLIIPEEEFKNRKDMRKECVFTIDPLTARDLDDALSCKILPDGNYEIGVHISDVGYFVEEYSELDEIISRKTTSVYMVNEVFHMLPVPLCLKCSLLPGEDKLAFSIFWKMNTAAEVIDSYITRTVINSCTQFAYEHAQKIIDNPDRIFSENDFPQIHNGFTVQDIVDRVKVMHSLAKVLRQKRFDNGALKINKPKLWFELHPDTGVPVSYSVYELKTANFMIEEFMLLANQYTAKFIHEHFPNSAILRNHEPPHPKAIKMVKERLAKLNLNLDITSSKAIYNSMQELINKAENPDVLEICIAHLISKPMKRANYFCSEKMKKEEFWHYALSIPIYTHFTSPIRRYPDILVHRLVSAALKYTSPPIRTPRELHFIAAICNENKYNAKVAGDDSSNLYFLHYIQSKKSVQFRAAILDFFSRAIEVILIETGHLVRIQLPREGKGGVKVTLNTKTVPYTAQLTYNNVKNYPSVELKIFSEILIDVSVGENRKLNGNFVIPPEVKKQQMENTVDILKDDQQSSTGQLINEKIESQQEQQQQK